jgi:hypothetical protein
MIAAIITELKKGTIKNVIPRGQNIVNPISPYVVVWGPETVQQAGRDREGKNMYYINTHFPKGYINQIDDYVYNELSILLPNKILLTTRDGRRVQLFVTMEIGGIVEGNTDGTISRERVFETVAMY